MATKTMVSAPVSAGIDVGAAELVLVLRNNAISMQAQTFANTPADRQRLVKRLSKLPGATVCLEATGVYYLDLALALCDAGIRLMVLNPKASQCSPRYCYVTARPMRWMPIPWRSTA